jgi:2-isopropylmalate synthase
MQKDNYFLVSYVLTNKSNGAKEATVAVKHNDEIVEKSAEAKGTLDALFTAVNKVFNIDFEVEQYDVQAVSSGSDAIADASIILKNNGVMYSGSGRDTDTVNASIKAYLNAANKTIITF